MSFILMFLGSDVLKISKPHSLCQYLEQKDGKLLGNVVLNWPWNEGKHFQTVFMVESRNRSNNISKWNFVGMVFIFYSFLKSYLFFYSCKNISHIKFEIFRQMKHLQM